VTTLNVGIFSPSGAFPSLPDRSKDTPLPTHYAIFGPTKFFSSSKVYWKISAHVEGGTGNNVQCMRVRDALFKTK
jgi:hypothetical protein